MMLGEQPRYKIFLYLVRIGDWPGAFCCLFWKDKRWFKDNAHKQKEK